MRPPRPPRELPLRRLERAWGPFRSDWRVYPDRLELRQVSPLGERWTPLDWDQVDVAHLAREAPPLAQWLVGFAAGGLAWVMIQAALGGAGMAGVAGAGVVLGLALALLHRARCEALVLETAAGHRFRVLGRGPRDPELVEFFRVLRGERAAATGRLDPRELDLLETDPELEVGGADEGPIDPRWIN